jgi:hypothetical protein
MISLLILEYILIFYQLLKVVFPLSYLTLKVSEYHFSNKAVPKIEVLLPCLKSDVRKPLV